jgi:hypothetical protein
MNANYLVRCAFWVRIFTALILATSARAVDDTIPIYLDSPGTIPGDTPRANFYGLFGTPVAGTLSVDFMFAEGEFVRAYPQTDWSFSFAIALHTTGNGLIGFMTGTGYALDQAGNPLPGYGVTGSASADDGEMFMGVYPLLSSNDGSVDTALYRPLDAYGVQFDITLPDRPDLQITDGQFAVFANGPFGIGPGIPWVIPEPGAFAFLCAAAVVFFVAQLITKYRQIK